MSELAVPDAQPKHAVAEPITIGTFEGEMVRHMVGKLPAITLEMDEGYLRGTHLQLAVTVRVRKVDFDELKKDGHVDLARIHHFALEAVQLVGAFTEEEVERAGATGGNASGGVVEDEEPDEEPGEHEEEASGESDVEESGGHSEGRDVGF